MAEEIRLSASARLIEQLGEQLIEDEFVALLELIKNGYDADARKVSVTIDTKVATEYGVGRITIKDDGNGMLPSIVKQSFLKLSTGFKLKEKTSPKYKRRVLGKKGIGRLSFQRLGRFIEVHTYPNITLYQDSDILEFLGMDTKLMNEDRLYLNGTLNAIDIKIDWSEFPMDMDFQDITAEVSEWKNEHLKNGYHGTEIIISGIRNINFWEVIDKTKEERIKTELLNMIDPYQKMAIKKESRFVVKLKIDGINYENDAVSEALLSKLSDTEVQFSFFDWVLRINIERKKKYAVNRRNTQIKRLEKQGFKLIGEEEDTSEDLKTSVVFDLFNDEKIKREYPKLNYKFQKLKSIDVNTFLERGQFNKLNKDEKAQIVNTIEKQFAKKEGIKQEDYAALINLSEFEKLSEDERVQLKLIAMRQYMVMESDDVGSCAEILFGKHIEVLSEDEKKQLRKFVLEQYAYPGNFEGKIFARDLLNRESLLDILSSEVAKKNGITTKKELDELWKKIYGVYVYRNGFRILPYGASDWIGFTRKSQTSINTIYKEHTVAGYIQIDGETSEKLEEQTNRQGFVMDEYGNNFKTIISNIILDTITADDKKFRDGYTKPLLEKENYYCTPNKKLRFEKLPDVELNKELALMQLNTVVKELSGEVSETLKEKISANLAKYEEYDIKTTQKFKQENYIKEQQLEEIKGIVPLLGLGLIAESLTHEMHRIEDNISGYARETINIAGENDRIVRIQRRILSEILYLRAQIAHLEATYRKNLEKIEEFYLKDFLEESFKGKMSPMALKAKNLNIVVNISGANPLVDVNKGRLITIFDNLFLNSLYWVNEFSRDNERWIRINIQKDGIIEFYDSGCGIHPEIEETLFEPFVFMKKDGRGVGLYIVKELVAQLGGTIYLSKERRDGRLYKFIINISSIVKEN